MGEKYRFFSCTRYWLPNSIFSFLPIALLAFTPSLSFFPSLPLSGSMGIVLFPRHAAVLISSRCGSRVCVFVSRLRPSLQAFSLGVKHDRLCLSGQEERAKMLVAPVP